ncbi:uncharacterized protein LOC115761974 [Drosophila novamexicana]|uniref:uncharacterized protein LOC115761974 n=1 Tax=Drosophila novamexicana TaxID=47314 RepID=UPI0011E5F129|nr:uncharacterized protein LOC115761974 [Drosophila novamexicana]
MIVNEFAGKHPDLHFTLYIFRRRVINCYNAALDAGGANQLPMPLFLSRRLLPPPLLLPSMSATMSCWHCYGKFASWMHLLIEGSQNDYSLSALCILCPLMRKLTNIVFINTKMGKIMYL